MLRALYAALFPEAEYPDDALLKTVDARITYVKNMCLKPDEIEALNQEIKGFPAIYRGADRCGVAGGRGFPRALPGI